MHLPSRVIDGGYISWAYGTRPGAIENWDELKSLYTRSANAVVAIDCNTSDGYRLQIDEGYKSRRRLMHQNPVRAENRALVHDFITEHILNDEDIATIQIPGLEADDLVAIYSILSDRRVYIVGEDKDLLQLPLARLHTIDGSRVTYANYEKRLNRSLRGCIQRSRDVLLLLALLGDRSDSIPRVLPHRRYDYFFQLQREPYPFQTAYRWFGERFLMNVLLAVLPGPFCFDPSVRAGDILQLLDSGDYSSQPLREDILSAINESYSVDAIATNSYNDQDNFDDY